MHLHNDVVHYTHHGFTEDRRIGRCIHETTFILFFYHKPASLSQPYVARPISEGRDLENNQKTSESLLKNKEAAEISKNGRNISSDNMSI